LVDCVSGDLPTELESNCFNWPAEEFTPENGAGLTTALAKGSTAIDFTLKTPSGDSYTLSSLLGTKPVLLVFGAFT
jgi:hypothetical protein